jgi:hypothetical protein
MFLKVFMLSPLEGGSGLKAKRNKSLLQSLGASGHKPLHIKKIGLAVFGG